MKKEIEPKLRCVGASKDYRTNRWEFICSCGKLMNPPTTMFFSQNIQCNKCGKQFFLNYNEKTIREIKL